MRPLFEINQELVWLEERLEADDEAGVEYSDELIQKISQHLDDLGAERDRKLDGYAVVIKQLDAEHKIAQEQYKEWRKKAEQREKRKAFLLNALKMHLEAVGQEKVKTGRFSFSVCSNGGVAPLRVDEDFLSDEFFYQPPRVPDNGKIRDALDRGESVPGAKYDERGKHVRIR